MKIIKQPQYNVCTCVSCGEVIPEGRQVCPICQKGATDEKQIEEKNCKECLHFEACSKWTDFPKQIGFPVCRKYRKQVEGEWLTETKNRFFGVKRRYCSICGKTPYFDNFMGKYLLTNYCPDCGAHMKGE